MIELATPNKHVAVAADDQNLVLRRTLHERRCSQFYACAPISSTCTVTATLLFMDCLTYTYQSFILFYRFRVVPLQFGDHQCDLFHKIFQIIWIIPKANYNQQQVLLVRNCLTYKSQGIMSFAPKRLPSSCCISPAVFLLIMAIAKKSFRH